MISIDAGPRKNKLSLFATGLQENRVCNSFRPRLTHYSLQLHPQLSLLLGYYKFLYWRLSLIFASFHSCVFCLLSVLLLFILSIIHLPFFLLPPATCPRPCHPAPAVFQLLFASCLSGAAWAEVSGLGGVGCGISVSACLCNRRRRVSGPLSADQHRCRWEVKSSPVTRAWKQWPMAEARPPSPLSSSVPSESVSCFIAYTSLSDTHTHTHSRAVSPAFSLLLLQQWGWSGLWQSAGIDRWTELETGWEDGWGQRREFNTGKHRETERNDLLGYAATHSPTAI